MRVITIEEHYLSERFGQDIGRARAPEVQQGLDARLHDLGEGRIAEMDAAGIDMQVLSLASPGSQTIDPTTAVSLVREENDYLAAAVSRHPTRLAAFAALPTTVPEAAAAELERTVRQHGFKGALINGTTGGCFLDHPSFQPLLESAEALDVPIYIHPAPPPKTVTDAYYGGISAEVTGALSTAAWGWHIEVGLHTLRLIAAGVFDRFPRLQIVIGHMGEALPFMLARAGSVIDAGDIGLQRPLGEYLRENVYYTTSGFFTVPPFLNALLVVGVERLIFSIDYPFAPNAPGMAFLAQIPVSPADKEKIAHGNVERLLKL